MKTKSMVLAAVGSAALGGVMIGFGSNPNAADKAVYETSRADAYAVDATHSSVVFKLGYMGVTNFYGSFEQMGGEYAIDLENPSSSVLDVVVMAESVDSNNDGRDKHLRGADFFSVKEFPEIRFVGKTFESAGENKVRITGDLTFHGVTREETTVLEWIGDRADPRGGHRSGWEAVLEINRSDYGVNYGVENGALGDKTTITVAITGMRQ